MSKRPSRYPTLLVSAMITAAAITPVFADEPVTLGYAVTKGKISLNLRYRYEDVDQADFDDRGRASTLRTTLGLSHPVVEASRCDGGV